MGLLKGSTRTFVAMNGGLDESSPVNAVAPEDCLVMSNFRLSRDGKRIEKRLGLTEEVTDFGADVYGYSTYYNNANTYCQLAVLESGISRKVGSAAWASIHTWSPVTLTGTIDPAASVNVVGVGTKFMSELRPGNSIIVSAETRTVSTITDDTHCTVTAAFSNNANDTTPDKSFTLAHPVVPIEIQGKQFVIHEDASRMVHIDGNDYQIGITAPTTLPTASESYATGATMSVSDTMDYANTTAMDAVWTDGDTGVGVSALAETGPPAYGNSHYMKFSFGTVVTACLAKRSKTIDSPGHNFTVEVPVYADAIGTRLGGKGFAMIIYNETFKTNIYFDWGSVSIQSNTGWKKLATHLRDSWGAWKFVIDGTDSLAPKITTYRGATKMSENIEFANPDTTSASIEFYAQAKDNTSQKAVIYVESIKISGEDGVSSVLEGTHRYAITYARGGNYGCESNPIKSVIGAVTFTGSGQNDMTVSSMSSYTGVVSKTFRVEIDLASSNPDTIKWSGDDGVTWQSESLNISTTMYLSYGIIINFGAVDGHTLGDYWYFTASSCSGAPTKQKVTLSSIPTSGDSQVTHRNIYRTTSGGSIFYWLATLNDNTTTSFVDNIPDMELGWNMGEDHDIAPNGKFSAWWDNRLWISGDDIVYYSALAIPEHFDLSARYITVNKGDPSDEITGIVPFKDALYVFRKKSIYSIQANSYGYGIYLVENHTGCRAPWSMVEVNNNLMFISDRGIEVFNGADAYPMALSDKIERTIKTIDTSKYDYITSVLVRDKYEAWFSIADRTSGSALTIVYNYIYGKFYYFSFYKTPSCLVSCENSSYALVTKMGTRDGFLDLCEAAGIYRDNTTAITATYRKGWMGGEKYENVRRIDVDYELPSSMTLTVNIYANYDKDVARTVALTGSTPSATDIELRRPIKGFGELGQRAEWWTVEFTNAENLGGDLKINLMSLYHFTTDTKGKIAGD
jgi:hypothetical protein